MKFLITLLIAATSVLAEPTILNYDYPLRHLYDYRYAVGSGFQPYAPVVRDLVSSALPVPDFHYEVPYYAGIKSQYHEQDIFGRARYGHIEPGQSQYAVQDHFGNKIGGFSYYDAEGKLKVTSYIADAAGYRVTSNNLPKDTPEVLAAKAAHFAEHEKIKSRAKRDFSSFSSFNTGNSHYNQPPTFPHAYPTTHLEPTVTKDGFLEETPEVLAATADHFAKVADSKARIAELQRFSGNNYQDYQRPVQPVQNTFTPVNHHTTQQSSFQNYDYRYHQPQNYQENFCGHAGCGATNGVPRDTPEVLAAKAKHFAELAANKARTASFAEPIQPVHSPHVSIANTPVTPHTSVQPLDYRYAKPFQHAYPTTNLEPVVTRDGFLEETPEVLAAKANHFAQHAAAQARALH